MNSSPFQKPPGMDRVTNNEMNKKRKKKKRKKKLREFVSAK